jgi:hypothetical protein
LVKEIGTGTQTLDLSFSDGSAIAAAAVAEEPYDRKMVMMIVISRY